MKPVKIIVDAFRDALDSAADTKYELEKEFTHHALKSLNNYRYCPLCGSKLDHQEQEEEYMIFGCPDCEYDVGDLLFYTRYIAEEEQ